MSPHTLHQGKRLFIDAKQFPLSLKIVLFFLLCFAGPAWLHAETLSGTVEDQTGAVIVGARIEITGGDLATHHRRQLDP